MSTAISVQNLHKTYAGSVAPALQGLSLQVEASSIFGLLGPNGSGKTTTLKIICGLLNADAGSVRVFDLDADKEKLAIRQRMGLAPQHIALYPTLTAWENIEYIGRLYQLSDRQIRERGTLLLERLGLAGHASKRVGRFSGGMKRRLNIIASLLHEPELLILDEPTASVDVQSRALILSFLKEYGAGGRTIVYTSHQLEEAEQLCDAVCIIDEGRTVLCGPPQDLIASTPDCRRLEDVFLHYTGHSVRD